MSEFTPGPWTATDDGLVRMPPTDDFSAPGVTVISPNEVADARLIAAAPDLYEALRACIEHEVVFTSDEWHVCGFCERSLPTDVIGDGPYDHRADCALFKARSALAKADGRE